jgi:hypothetical protein
VLGAEGYGGGREFGGREFSWLSDRSSQRDSGLSLGAEAGAGGWRAEDRGVDRSAGGWREADRSREGDRGGELLTPTERMRKKKMEEADRRSHELKQVRTRAGLGTGVQVGSRWEWGERGRAAPQRCVMERSAARGWCVSTHHGLRGI